MVSAPSRRRRRSASLTRRASSRWYRLSRARHRAEHATRWRPTSARRTPYKAHVRILHGLGAWGKRQGKVPG